MKYYVYAYKDPVSNQPFYIGKGSGKRYLDHLNKPYQSVKRCQDKIKSIKEKGLEPLIDFVKKELTEQDAYELEDRLIREYGRKGIDNNGILMNICLGAMPPLYKNDTIIESYYQEPNIELTKEILDATKLFLDNTQSRKRFTQLLRSPIGRDFIRATKHFPVEYNVPQRLWHLENGEAVPTCVVCDGLVSFKAHAAGIHKYARTCSVKCNANDPVIVEGRNIRNREQSKRLAEQRRGKPLSQETKDKISAAKKGKVPHQWTKKSKEKLRATRLAQENTYRH